MAPTLSAMLLSVQLAAAQSAVTPVLPQAPLVLAGPVTSDSIHGHAIVTLSDSGLVVRFPRSMSPDSITREMGVDDLFSGYEWRVILLGKTSALLTAFVIPVNDSLIIHRYRTIKAAFDAGGFRTCTRNAEVLDCDRLARGLVRDANGQLEIGILDRQWLAQAFQSGTPTLRLVVKRAREILWTEDVPIKVHIP
jgi:hypothetical protein